MWMGLLRGSYFLFVFYSFQGQGHDQYVFSTSFLWGTCASVHWLKGSLSCSAIFAQRPFVCILTLQRSQASVCPSFQTLQFLIELDPFLSQRPFYLNRVRLQNLICGGYFQSDQVKLYDNNKLILNALHAIFARVTCLDEVGGEFCSAESPRDPG